MKKIYAYLVATIASLTLCNITNAQTNTFTAALSNSWANAGNWSLGTVPANSQTIVIPTGKSSFILGTVVLNGVTIKVQVGASLVIGNGAGAAKKGVLTLDNASAISLGGPGNTATIKANTKNNNNNRVTIGGITVFRGNTVYAVNPGSGRGIITGPAQATFASGGFIFAALPVVLVNFQANLTNEKKVAVSWTTQQEINSDNFNVERSNDGLNWASLATIKAAGNSSVPLNYSYSDGSPLKGANLYRIRINDLDGKVGYTEIKNVRISAIGKISLFPNPSTDRVTISLGDVPASVWTVTLVNNMGQIVLQKRYEKSNTNVTIPLNAVAEGNYTILIIDAVSIKSSKLIISRK